MKYDAVQDRDDNFQPIGGLSLNFRSKKRITFAGGTANAIGDHDGTSDPFTIFEVTGDVMVSVFAIVKTTLVGAGTIEVGVVGATAEILGQLADATALSENDVWYVDGFPGLAKSKDQERRSVVAGGLDIIGTIGTANITAGVLDFYCFWRPLSDDGNVVGD